MMGNINMTVPTKWVKYYNTEYCIQPFPFSLHRVDGEAMENMVIRFLHCICEVKKNGETFKYTDEEKTFIFDYKHKLRDFLIEEITKVEGIVEEEIKN